jgi:hypothetical protein
LGINWAAIFEALPQIDEEERLMEIEEDDDPDLDASPS